jgi:hypothetical protein
LALRTLEGWQLSESQVLACPLALGNNPLPNVQAPTPHPSHHISFVVKLSLELARSIAASYRLGDRGDGAEGKSPISSNFFVLFESENQTSSSGHHE